MKQKQEITQGFIQDIFNIDYHIKTIFITDNLVLGVYELKILLWDDFVIPINIDMGGFDEEEVITVIKDVLRQVYGPDRYWMSR